MPNDFTKKAKVNVLSRVGKITACACNRFCKARVPVKKSNMKKIILLTGIALFASAFCLHAQSIDNKNWKAYLEAPINDTVVFHIQSDSSFVTNSNGDVVIRMRCFIAGDTLTMVNLDAEQHGCADQKGKYKVNYKDDSFMLTLIDDACEGRAQALQGRKWNLVTK